MSPEEIAECTEKITSLKTCLNCVKGRKSAIEKRPVFPKCDKTRNPTWFELGGERYCLGSFVFIDKSVWPRPTKGKKGKCEEYEYRKSHPELYTEMYRKKHSPYE